MADTESWHDHYLKALEEVLEQKAGKRQFCYWPVLYSPESSLNFWRLSAVCSNENGYHPISDDLYMGDEAQMKEAARALNRDRLGLSPDDTAAIVLANMSKK